MKTKLLFKSLLVAATLLLGGANSVWAYTSALTTMTGRVGLTNNSSAAFYYASKPVTLAAGETYTYTFVNHNGGSGNLYNNWILEGNNGTNYFDFRADGGYWGSIFDKSQATNSYSGNTYTDISSDANTWLTAYNGVTVTLTATRSSNGATLTFTHSATTNTSVSYTGTFTVNLVSASDAITFYITNEKSYQDIQKVVYTDASDVVTNYELKNIDLSKFDSYFSGSYSDGTATFTNSGSSKVWATMALSDYFESISGTITNVNMIFKENVGGGGRITIGIYGNDKSSWATNAYQDTEKSVSVWGIVGSSYTRRIYYGSSYVNGVLTYDAEAAIEVDMDIINKKFTWIQDGTTRVNNQAFVDTDITLPQYLALYSWSATNTTTLSDMTMEIVYVEASYYTATFTNTTSGNTPSVTIYTDSERSSEIANGLLEDGTTYYYTATEIGYHNYNGSFTVSGADPNVEFAMTAKTVYNYSVNAIDGESGVIKSSIVSGTCYADETTSFYLPDGVLVDGTLYFRTGEDSYKSETVTSNNQVFTYAYTTASVDNVVFFVEGESISGASTSTATNNQRLASNGYMGRGSDLTVTTLPAGAYTIYVHYINTNASGHSVVVKAGETDVINNASVSARPTINGSITLTENTTIKLTAAASSTSGVDYLYIVKTAEVKTITAAGWATYCSPYALDFSSAIANLDAAYMVTGGADDKLTLEKIATTIPANTGVLLKGSAGTVNIPVVASSSTDVSSNKLQGVTANTNKDANTIYVLMNDATNGIGFYKNENAFTVGANTAYLNVADLPDPSSARAFYSLGGDVTGIQELKNSRMEGSQSYYDLQGRRVANPTKGLYIVNGKKVIK